MIDPTTIQIIIQGGAVGILLAFGVGGFILAKLLINRGFEFVNNHMAHNTEAVADGTEATREVVAEIKRLTDRLDKNANTGQRN